MQTNYTSEEIVRFWGNVEKTENPKECWTWKASRHQQGYGRWKPKDGRKRLAHRVVWEMTFGEIPDGLDVLHSCDNPPCCNPNHLFLGTHQDNMSDKKMKGRVRSGARIGEQAGEGNFAHKLSESQVSEIRRRYARWGIGGEHSGKLAKEFGVSPSQILNIVNHKSWT